VVKLKLLTAELLARFRALGDQEESEDPVVVAKYFHPMSSWTFFAISYHSEGRVFFGFASITGPPSDELGYTSLTEMESTCVLGLGIERDLYWVEKPLSEAKRELPWYE
jgi:hypothetical protein